MTSLKSTIHFFQAFIHHTSAIIEALTYFWTLSFSTPNIFISKIRNHILSTKQRLVTPAKNDSSPTYKKSNIKILMKVGTEEVK